MPPLQPHPRGSVSVAARCVCAGAAGSALPGDCTTGTPTLSHPDSLIANALTFHPCVCVCVWHFVTLGVVFMRGWGGGGCWFVVAKLSGGDIAVIL